MQDYDKQHVLVLGGTRGIGLSVASMAAGRGATVSVVSSQQHHLTEAVDLLSSPIGSRIYGAVADARDPDALSAAVNEIKEQSSQPFDVVVSAVGGAIPDYFNSLTISEFRAQMDLNFFTAVNLTKAVLPDLRQQGSGHLVYLASTAALIGVYGYTAYSASKWAVRGFAESLRTEVEPVGIKVSTVFPPDTLTPGYEAEMERKPPETVAASGSIKPRDPGSVATAILDGVLAGRSEITADPTTKLLTINLNPAVPYGRWMMRRKVAAHPGEE